MENFISNYFEYLKNNPQKLWFRKKIYGWGWTPVRWQGWLTVALHVALIIFIAQRVTENSTASEMIFNFFLPLIFVSALLIFIAYKTGEKPCWQWGNPKDKK